MSPRVISQESICANIYIQRCPRGTRCRLLHFTMPLYADPAVLAAGRIFPPGFGYTPAHGPIFPAAALSRVPLITGMGTYRHQWMGYRPGMEAPLPMEHQARQNGHCEGRQHPSIDGTPTSPSRPLQRGRTPSESSSSSAPAPSLYPVQSSSTTTLVSSTGSSSPRQSNSPFEEKHDGHPEVDGLHEYYCWAYVQGLCKREKCLSYHPKDIRPYIKSTPCLTYPTCFGGHQCPFKHPSNTPGAQAPLPEGATEYNGAMYFPVPLAPPAYNAPAAYALVMPHGLELVAPEKENYDYDYACEEAEVEVAVDAGASMVQTPTGTVFMEEVNEVEETPRAPERKAKKRAHRASVSITSRKMMGEVGELKKGRHMRHKSWAVFEQQ